MKTIELELLKKNRKYWKARTENGYEVKVLIDEKSENLEIGKQALLVEDISVRTKYGTDVIFQVVCEEIKEEKSEKIVTLHHPRYNKKLVSACQELGGRWDAGNKTWVFHPFVEEKVEELDYLFNSEEVEVKATAINDVSVLRDSVTLFGYTLCYATGRDSGAKVAENVIKIGGSISSGGSMKNWSTEVEKGTVFILKVPKLLLDKYEIKKFNIEIIG